jgi:hypothetical protein
MGAFDPIEVAWKGRTYTIPPRRVMGAIARIEDVLTFNELQAFERRDTLPLAKLSMAYGAVLRYAGATVADEDVYADMFGQAGAVQQVSEAVIGLMMMMMPRAVRQQIETALAGPGGDDKAGEHDPGNAQPTAASL